MDAKDEIKSFAQVWNVSRERERERRGVEIPIAGEQRNAMR